jgi:hypothetical protein
MINFTHAHIPVCVYVWARACNLSLAVKVVNRKLFSTLLNAVTHGYTHTYRVSREECKKLRESVPYVKIYRYNPKHLYPKLNSYGDNGQRKVWTSLGSTHCSCQLTTSACPSFSVVSYYISRSLSNLHTFMLIRHYSTQIS